MISLTHVCVAFIALRKVEDEPETGGGPEVAEPVLATEVILINLAPHILCPIL